jgi:hypothetical protein
MSEQRLRPRLYDEPKGKGGRPHKNATADAELVAELSPELEVLWRDKASKEEHRRNSFGVGLAKDLLKDRGKKLSQRDIERKFVPPVRRKLWGR